MSPPTSTDFIRTITTLSCALPTPIGAAAATGLRQATRDLIAAMQAEGRLSENPLELALTRSVDLHTAAAAQQLQGKRVMVTGGSGCVGTRLRQLLAGFEPAALFNLDIVPHLGEGTWLEADIRDPVALDTAFAEARPEVVFHLASIREPGKAEMVVRAAVDTNVFGTAHVIAACRRHGVAKAVYSSTGKCFAYLTDHVYTASKKLAEAQWAAAERQGGPTLFAMTRFTHVLENGIVARDIADGIEHGLIGLHGADRYFNVQNLRQATHLLVNALALAGEQAPNSFWSAVDLGWPVNTLELALFEIARSGRDVGVHFLGVPKGYDESFFRGQFDWSDEYEYHPLVNALEAHSMFSDSTGTMIGAGISACPDNVLSQVLAKLRQTLDAAGHDTLVKPALLQAVGEITAAIFSQVDCRRLLDILWWGAAPEWAGSHAAAARFRPIMAMLADAILLAPDRSELLLDDGSHRKIDDIAKTFSAMPGLEGWAAHFLNSAQPLRVA